MEGPIPEKIAEEWVELLTRDTFFGHREWHAGLYPQDDFVTGCGKEHSLCIRRKKVESGYEFEMRVCPKDSETHPVYTLTRWEGTTLYKELSVLWDLAKISENNKGEHRRAIEQRKNFSMETVHRDITENIKRYR